MTLYDKYLQNYGKTWGLAVLQKKIGKNCHFILSILVHLTVDFEVLTMSC